MPAHLTDPSWGFLKYGGVGNLRAANTTIITRPRLAKGDGTVRGFIYAHGAGGTASMWTDAAGQLLLGRVLSQRYIVLADDWAGGLAWGNDNAVTDMNTANTFLPLFGASTMPKIVGATSMGGLQSIRYAAKYPTQVAGLLLLVPALNLNEIRGAIASTRADQDTAWGVTYAVTPVIPEPAGPSASINMLTLASQIQCPVFLAYAPDDTIVSPASAIAFVNAVNANAYPAAVATLISVGNLGHSDAAVIAAVPWAEAWLSQTFPDDVKAA
jgi:pimeloyl-ACP methyl ester carboxylesterase